MRLVRITGQRARWDTSALRLKGGRTAAYAAVRRLAGYSAKNRFDARSRYRMSWGRLRLYSALKPSKRSTSWCVLGPWRRSRWPRLLRSGSTLPPEVYTRDEVRRLLDGTLGRNEETRTRNRALLVVLWRAGLRVSEALDLRMADLRPEEGGVWVRRGLGAAEGRQVEARGDGRGVV